MITIYLRFPDRTAALGIFGRADGAFLPDILLDDRYCAVDVCFGTGTLMAAAGDVDGDGNPVMAPIEGFHVNVLSETSPPSLAAWTINPNSPDIVFG